MVEAISYEDDGMGGVVEVKIADVEARVQEVMVDATLAELAGWGIITEPSDWGSIYPNWPLSQLFDNAITIGGGTPGTP